MAESDSSDFDPEFGSFLFWRLPILDGVPRAPKICPLLADRNPVVGEEDDDMSQEGSDWSADDEEEDTDLEAGRSSTHSRSPETYKPTLSLHRQLTIENYKLRLERTVSSTDR